MQLCRQITCTHSYCMLSRDDIMTFGLIHNIQILLLLIFWGGHGGGGGGGGGGGVIKLFTM